jgi:hypothetical protein
MKFVIDDMEGRVVGVTILQSGHPFDPDQKPVTNNGTRSEQ